MAWHAQGNINWYQDFGGYGAGRIIGIAQADLSDDRRTVKAYATNIQTEYWSSGSGIGFVNSMMLCTGSIKIRHAEHATGSFPESIIGAGNALDRQMVAMMNPGYQVLAYIWLKDNVAVTVPATGNSYPSGQSEANSLIDNGLSYTWNFNESWAPGTRYLVGIWRYYAGNKIAVVEAEYIDPVLSFPQDYFPMSKRKSGLWVPTDDAGSLQLRSGGTWHNVKNRYDKADPHGQIRQSGWKQMGK